MGRYGKDTESKLNKIQKFLSDDLSIGETVKISPEYFKETKGYLFSPHSLYKILEIEYPNVILVEEHKSGKEIPKQIDIKYIGERKGVYNIGVDPFFRKFLNTVRPVAYELGSIVHTLELQEKRRDLPVIMNGHVIPEVNWDPFVIINGEKKFYQRSFCWTDEQEKLLIESVYKGIYCGSILIRLRGWDVLERMASKNIICGFREIVDGKQRLHTIRRFLNNEFQDSYGNYFGDLSDHAQHDFLNHQLFSYAEMKENTSDEEVLYQFLKMNYEGVPQSKEHLEYVNSLIKSIR